MMHKRKDKRLISRILLILLVATCLVFLSGCGMEEMTEEVRTNMGRFEYVESIGDWWVVYDRDTMVMYAVSDGMYNRGDFTLLVDADGKPLLWNGKGDDF